MIFERRVVENYVRLAVPCVITILLSFSRVFLVFLHLKNFLIVSVFASYFYYFTSLSTVLPLLEKSPGVVDQEDGRIMLNSIEKSFLKEKNI